MAFTEKTAIEIKLRELSEEKSRLLDRLDRIDAMYLTYINRLREIDIFAPVETRSEVSSQVETPRDSVDSIDRVVQVSEDAREPAEALEDVKIEDKAVEDSSPSTPAPRKESKDIREIKKPTGGKIDKARKKAIEDARAGGGHYDLQSVADETVSILKEFGEPIKISLLKEFLAERGYTWKGQFSNTITNLQKYTDKIARPKFGHVAYAEPSETTSQEVAVTLDQDSETDSDR